MQSYLNRSVRLVSMLPGKGRLLVPTTDGNVESVSINLKHAANESKFLWCLPSITSKRMYQDVEHCASCPRQYTGLADTSRKLQTRMVGLEDSGHLFANERDIPIQDGRHWSKSCMDESQKVRLRRCTSNDELHRFPT